VFFDGTGNNKTVDKPLNRWSNPARIWQSAQMMPPSGNNFAIYVSGVGTTFNGEPVTWERIKDEPRTVLELSEVPGGVAQDKLGGNAAGAGGTRRTEYGQKQVNDVLRKALLSNAKTFNAVTKAYADKNMDAKLSDISAKLKPFELVKVINLSVFGFSRGAALARAFVNDFLGHCKTEKGQLVFNHHPVRIRFLGLFDTVASFGLPSANIDAPFDEKNLVVPDVVERCVHFVAAHELRFSFPVDLIRKNGAYRANWKECAYPGVHSDVGGGYEPAEQGISHNYARIPMRNMMREAVVSGVRLVGYDEMSEVNDPMFERLYKVLPKTDERFGKYMAEVKPSGTMEQAITAHMKALYSGFGTMTRQHILTPDLVEAKGSIGHALIGHIGIAEEADLFLHPDKQKPVIRTGAPIADAGRELIQASGKLYRQYVRPEAWRLQAWQATCSPAVLDFIQYTVHDSKAGFICGIEPFSYFRPRGMAESSRNVLARGLDWLDDRAADVWHGLYKIYHTLQGVVVETWELNKLLAKVIYKVGVKFTLAAAKAGKKYAVEVYQEGKEVLISTLQKGEQMLVTSIAVVKKEAGELAAATQKKAGELSDATQKKAGELADATQKKAGELADATQKKAGEFADAVENKAVEVGQQIKSGASAIKDGAGKLIDTGLQKIEQSWNPARYGLGF
jgi:hypothetical protein